jgi:hypothetical protein
MGGAVFHTTNLVLLRSVKVVFLMSIINYWWRLSLIRSAKHLLLLLTVYIIPLPHSAALIDNNPLKTFQGD